MAMCVGLRVYACEAWACAVLYLLNFFVFCLMSRMLGGLFLKTDFVFSGFVQG